MDAGIIDAIYDAAFFPGRWPGVLDKVATIVGARGGVVFTANRAVGVLRHVASTALHEDMECYSRDGWLFRGSRLPRLTAHSHAGFVVERDLFSDNELSCDPTYRDFLHPRGLGWAAGTIVALPTEDIVVISLERDYERGPVEPQAVAWLDTLRPHFARSTLIAARLQLARSDAAAATLDLLGLPALVLDDAGRVIVANAHVATAGGAIHWRARDKVALNDAITDHQLTAALARVALDQSGGVCSFVIRGDAAHPAMIAHLLPMRRDTRDLFAGAAAILVITPSTAPAAPPIELIQSLFDLTAAEARVARGLAGGNRLDEIAAAAGVSRNTVRSQLQAVLEKTGSRRQQDVVALLSGVGTTRIQAIDILRRGE